MRLLIVRHGDPDYEKDTLTKKGHREASLLAEKLKNEKIDYIYTSPLGRAKDTCSYTAKALGMEDKVVVLDWLREFYYIWDMLPQEWTASENAYDRDRWKEENFYRVEEIGKKYDQLAKAWDELLSKHGYTREGGYYRTEKGNSDTVAIFCHFGLEMMLLSRLFNISPIVFSHHFVALPSSLTTVYTEERREGIAIFRCAGFGDTGHLYAGEEQPSFAARFCEKFDDDTRHD
ncbi:MAG: histidine phosphatase family protein [Clostridiales bacterium]|nr:histidine phosphatase family protein [Clostridiales bacterium]